MAGTAALCAETDPEAFFPEKGGSTREAKRICSGCEVRAQCLEYALAHDERFGIWGGLSERERRRLKAPGRLTPAARLTPGCRNGASRGARSTRCAVRQAGGCSRTPGAPAAGPEGGNLWSAGAVWVAAPADLVREDPACRARPPGRRASRRGCETPLYRVKISHRAAAPARRPLRASSLLLLAGLQRVRLDAQVNRRPARSAPRAADRQDRCHPRDLASSGRR